MGGTGVSATSFGAELSAGVHLILPPPTANDIPHRDLDFTQDESFQDISKVHIDVDVDGDGVIAKATKKE